MPLTTSSFDHAGAYWAAPSPAKRRTASPARFSSPAQTPSADAHSPAALRPVKKTPVKNTPVKKEIKPLFLGLLVLAMGGAGASVLLVVRESPDFLPLEARAAAAIGLCSVGVWLLSIPLVDVSIVDIWWPVAFVVQALAVSEGSALEPRQRICLALICIWALRLAGFLIYRKVLEGGKEDTRYADYVLLCKRGMHPNWQVVLASLLNPFLVQALMQLLVGSPVVFVFGRSTAHPLGTLDLVAALLWCAGFVFEAGSDLQLAIFKADGANRGKVQACVPLARPRNARSPAPHIRHTSATHPPHIRHTSATHPPHIRLTSG